MRRLKLFILLAVSASLFGCNKIDNFDEPNGHIQGSLIDKTTDELIPCQAPNGARIKLFEGESTQAINLWPRIDGTYNSDRVFDGTYRIEPEGPFIVTASDAVTVKLPAGRNVDFTVEPYLRIELSDATLNGTEATVKFTISRSAEWVDGSMTDYAILYSETESISINGRAPESITVTVPSGTETGILGVEQTVTIEDIDTSKPVYVRVAAKASVSSYWNYSVVERLDL